jgi:drug/metabolite transporter (DMT)-like permease
MGLALAAYSLLSVQDATVKLLVVAMPVSQILCVRSAVLVVGCLVSGGRPLVRHVVSTSTRLLLARRGAVTLAAWSCYFTAARDLPLGQLITLYFTAPVIVTLLASAILREHVGHLRWTAVGIGFAGTLLAANPIGVSLSLPTVLALIAAVLWGYGVILTRQIARLEPTIVQMFFNNCFFLLATGVTSALVWHRPGATEFGLLAIVVVLGGIGQLCLFESARYAPASLTAPLEYTALVWAFLLGFLIWNDGVLLGAGLVLTAGLTLFISERRSQTTALPNHRTPEADVPAGGPTSTTGG